MRAAALLGLGSAALLTASLLLLILSRAIGDQDPFEVYDEESDE